MRSDKTIAAGELGTALPALDAQASGIVLEIGPGTGNQLSRYDLSKITKIYGVEPNTDLHGKLRANVKKYGLSDIYTIVPCGIEDVSTLYEYGVVHGTIDTVMSVQVLCGVPQPAKMVKEMYKLLKKGGQMIVYEHVRSDDFVSHVVQRLYNVVWPYGMGGCQLVRPTREYLIEAGRWEWMDLEGPSEEEGWSLFPRVQGRLLK
jgi:SAM-dependent methyltransferase